MDATVPEKVYSLSKSKYSVYSVYTRINGIVVVLDHGIIGSLRVKAREYEEARQSKDVCEMDLQRFGVFAARVFSSWNSETSSEDVKFLGFVYYTALYQFYQMKFPLRRASCKTLSEEHDISIVLMRHLLSTFAEAKHEPDGPTTYVAFASTYLRMTNSLIDIFRQKLTKINCCFIS